MMHAIPVCRMMLLVIDFFLVLYAGRVSGRLPSNSLKTNGHTALEPSDISHAENVPGPLPTISIPLQKNIQHQLYARSRSSGRYTQDREKAHEDHSGVDGRHIYSRPSSGWLIKLQLEECHQRTVTRTTSTQDHTQAVTKDLIKGDSEFANNKALMSPSLHQRL
jgi:hypothetical protein